MHFLLNDVVLGLDLQLLTPPVVARRFSALNLDAVEELGRELFAEEPNLQHTRPEQARRLAALIVSKAPDVNAALFVAPARGCPPAKVRLRLARLDLELAARLRMVHQSGQLTPVLADRLVWARMAA